ncbi:MAG TPA: ammonia channel protein, partial [Opitutaceae bacterium]|nr:ammonia channel protein [Opitutaceae bacterium]
AIKSIDFAGGIVVHMTSGWSALALCILLGKRRGHGREPMPPHSMVLCMVGTGMLWAGWYGFNAGSAVGIGLAAGAATFFACNVLKRKFGYDDSLDTFGVHAVGGTLGTILAGVFATTAANPNLGAPHLAGLVGQTLWLEQVKAGALVLGWSVAGTLVLAKITGWACGGLRVDEEDEVAGLDVTEHGEEGYILE